MEKIYKKIKDICTNKMLLSIVMACFSYSYMCLTHLIPTYNLTSWLVFFAFIILFIKTDIYNKEYKKEIILLTILLTFISVYGSIAYKIQDSRQLSVFSELVSLENVISFIGIFNLIYIILTSVFPKLLQFKMKNNKSIIKKQNVLFLGSILIIIAAWIPYFLSFYPGILSSDSVSELTTIINNFSSVSDHHPVMHTVFVAIPYNIGYGIFRSVEIGVVFATVVQMIILATIFASLIVFLHNRKVNDVILTIILLFFALGPMHGYYSITMWKDVMFAGMLLLLTMELVKIVEKDKKNTLGLKKLTSFIIISIICVFFRNNAIYMYIILAVVTIIIFRKHLKIFLLAFTIVFGVYFIVKGPVFNILNISTSASAEYIGMPLQQIGRMAYKNVKFTENEKKLINELIPIETLREVYNPRISDEIKFNSKYNGSAFDENKFEYLKLWLKLIIKHPGIAIESYTISTIGYWYPGVEYWSVANEIWEGNSYKLKTESKVPNLISNGIKKIESRSAPILNMQWSIGLCVWIILLFAIITIKRKGLKGIYIFTPVIGIWITMLVAAPVYAEFRYVYGLYTCLPLLMLVPYIKEKKYKNQ